jgi:hypothetical protein
MYEHSENVIKTKSRAQEAMAKAVYLKLEKEIANRK